MNISIIEGIFWVGIAICTHVYFVYPIILFFQSKINKNREGDHLNENIPKVTIFIPCFNEEAVLSDKIENACNLHYPLDLIEIAIASDGSTDRTNEILEDEGKRLPIKVFYNERNEGKNHLINNYVPLTNGQIIVFTDANSIFLKNSIKNIVRHFTDKSVGCVGGQLKYLTGKSAVAKGEGLYFKYENFIRRLEGKRGKMIGANGAIYAIRRELFEEVPEHVPNDFFHPLTVLKKGYKSVFEENAIAYEKATENRAEEFKRRSRIVARSISALVEVNRRFGSSTGKVWFNILSHKILRWLTFPLLVCLWILNLSLIESPLYFIFFLIQNTFFILGAFGYLLEKIGMKIKIFYIPYYFLLINLACFIGLIQWLKGRRIVSWKTASTTR